MERAEYFLRKTALPVKGIAAECGVTDLQHFNKLVRRFFGKSPRAIRAEATEKRR
jgi:transcriptional regulator GlxA family with amidase domain